jgi:BirA family biotin operon repressor/biotin-[acetyl-CoA-carboxylase] ligase
MHKIIHLKSTYSTNTYANKILKKSTPEDGSVIITDNQLTGRGHDNNNWESQDSMNLTFSIIYYPIFLPIIKQFYLSKCISLGILNYLKEYSNNISIKWPNDIYIGDKKIAGILIENSIMGNSFSNSIIGIGLNINQEVFYSDAPNPISLYQLSSKKYNLNTELSKLLNSINIYYAKLKNMGYIEIDNLYLSNLYRVNQYSRFKAKDNVFNGKIIGVSEFGYLQIETKEKNLKEFDFKEIQFLDI